MNRPDAFVRRCKRLVVRWLVAAAALLVSAGAVQAETVLRIVMNSDLKILDPIWNTAFVIRDHGYMVYDTLFATDAEGEIRPQMVDRTEISADKLVYTFTLRDGLKWHDGQPVTAEDCVASIKRWAARDAVGQKLMTFVLAVEAKDTRTIEIRLKEPTALLLPALGKPNSNVPFMMPRRIAETDPFTQITDPTGSGPFIFKRDEWRPGHLAVYVKNPDYKPRAEPVSRLAGGKRALVDRIEWHAMPDHLQAINALQAGEIDFIEAPPFDLHALLKADKNVQLMTLIMELNRLYRSQGALHVHDVGLAGFEWVDANDEEHSVYAFLRKGASERDVVLAIFNCTPVPRYDYRVGVPIGGTWREILNTDAAAFGGSGMGNFGAVTADAIAFHNRPASLRLTLPPLGALYFTPEPAGAKRA